MIQKLLIISHSNTVPFMTRIDVIKRKPPRNRMSADENQHREALIMEKRTQAWT